MTFVMFSVRSKRWTDGIDCGVAPDQRLECLSFSQLDCLVAFVFGTASNFGASYKLEFNYFYRVILMNFFNAPILIIGMHRTGTSLLSRVLNDAGVFMGVLRDHNGESFPFLSVNQKLVPDWTHPETVLNGIDIRPETMLAAHFQLPNEARWRLIPQIGKPWGWKDPRNTFTVQAWLTLFPNLRLIHMRRQEASVVNSLLQRNHKPGEFRLDLSGAEVRALHKQYEQEAIQYHTWGSRRYMEVHYELLLQRDAKQIRELSIFCGVKIHPYLEQHLRR
jgi:hypothetical protein